MTTQVKSENSRGLHCFLQCFTVSLLERRQLNVDILFRNEDILEFITRMRVSDVVVLSFPVVVSVKQSWSELLF